MLYDGIDRNQKGLHPHILYQYKKQFKLFLAFVISHQILDLDSVLWCSFLAANAITFRVVMNYVSALKYTFARYVRSLRVFENSMIKRMLRGISYTVHVLRQRKGLFTLKQVREISRLCEISQTSQSL